MATPLRMDVVGGGAASEPFPWASLGAFAGGALGFLGGSSTNAANARMARAQMDFQERMSNTAHQREVRDLRAAGLNPILSGTGGMGSSTPGGSTATMQNAVSSAVDAHRTQAEIANMRKQNENIQADTDLKKTERIRAAELAGLHEWQARTEAWHSRSAEALYEGHRIERDIDREGTGDWSRRIQRFLGPANSAISLGRGRMSEAMGKRGSGLRVPEHRPRTPPGWRPDGNRGYFGGN